MSLEPGDRAIMEVRPWFAEGEDSRWTCSRCGRWFPRGESWLVEYRHEDGDRLAFVVCGDCALQLMPRRLTIDLSTLQDSRHDEDLAPVKRLVNFITTHRSETPRGELRLRASDVYILSQVYGTSTAQLAMRLRDEGLLADL